MNKEVNYNTSVSAFWPLAVFRSVENLANSMSALCRLAVVRQG